MAYVPPNKRDTFPKIEEFPTLGTNKVQSQTNTWKNTKSFASLASDWKKKQDKDDFENALKNEMEQKQREKERIENTHFIYHKQRHVEVETYYDDEDCDISNKDDWEMIERKQRRILTTEEKIQRDLERERMEKEANEEFDECEADKWDFRDRRIHS